MKFLIETYSFEQFLEIAGDKDSLELYREVPFPNYGYDKLVGLFHQYCLVGGIPEVVEQYASDRNIQRISPLYDKTLERLFSTAAAIVRMQKTSERVVQIYQDSFTFAAMRIKYKGFSDKRFRSREVSTAFRLLQEKRLIKLLYPTIKPDIQLDIDKSRSPRIQLPDTGLVNYFTGIQEALTSQDDLSAVFNRQISMHVVAQELLAAMSPANQNLHFWVREKTQSSAEVDFVIEYQDLLIPIEVKRGEPGRLRSLHQFIEAAPHPFAVRLYAGPLIVKEAHTVSGKTFYLMSLPYFLGGKIREHLEGFIKFVRL